jgi:hypothetical protein
MTYQSTTTGNEYLGIPNNTRSHDLTGRLIGFNVPVSALTMENPPGQ